MLGATNPVSSLVKAINDGKEAGKSYLEVKAEWKSSAGLMTFDDAVKAAAGEKYELYAAEVAGKIVSLQDRRAIARRVTGEDVFFDWELPRNPAGQYLWQWSVKAVINRTLLAAPLGDVSWSRQGMSS